MIVLAILVWILLYSIYDTWNGNRQYQKHKKEQNERLGL